MKPQWSIISLYWSRQSTDINLPINRVFISGERNPLRCRVRSGEERGTVVLVRCADGPAEERLVAAARHHVAAALEVRPSTMDYLLCKHVRVSLRFSFRFHHEEEQELFYSAMLIHFSKRGITFPDASRYYGFGLWLPELFNRFENYHQSHPNASVTVCELIHDTQSLNHTVPEEPFLLLANGATECKPRIDERVFINSLTINAVCLFGNVASGYLANRVGRRTMPSTLLTMIPSCLPDYSDAVLICGPWYLSLTHYEMSFHDNWIFRVPMFPSRIRRWLVFHPWQSTTTTTIRNKCTKTRE